MTHIPRYEVPVVERVAGATDSRGRPVDMWTTRPESLRAIAVAPATALQKEEAAARSHEASWRFFFPRHTEVPSDARLTWLGRDWDVVSVLDYSHGVGDLGGVEAIAGRRGDASNEQG